MNIELRTAIYGILQLHNYDGSLTPDDLSWLASAAQYEPNHDVENLHDFMVFVPNPHNADSESINNFYKTITETMKTILIEALGKLRTSDPNIHLEEPLGYYLMILVWSK